MNFQCTEAVLIFYDYCENSRLTLDETTSRRFPAICLVLFIILIIKIY